MEKRGFVIFLARIQIEYFHLGSFVTLGVYLIKKYGCHTQAYFSLFQSFSGYRDKRWFHKTCKKERLSKSTARQKFNKEVRSVQNESFICLLVEGAVLLDFSFWYKIHRFFWILTNSRKMDTTTINYITDVHNIIDRPHSMNMK